jgi:hypothetical protein
MLLVSPEALASHLEALREDGQVPSVERLIIAVVQIPGGDRE